MNPLIAQSTSNSPNLRLQEQLNSTPENQSASADNNPKLPPHQGLLSRSFALLRDVCAIAINRCAQAMAWIFNSIFQFPDRANGGGENVPNLSAHSIELVDNRSNADEETSATIAPNQRAFSRHIVDICGSIALDHLRPNDRIYLNGEDQRADSPAGESGLIPRPPVSIFSAFTEPSLALVHTNSQSYGNLPRWFSIYNWRAHSHEVRVRHQLAELLTHFGNRSAVDDRFLVDAVEFFSDLSICRSDEFNLENYRQRLSLKEFITGDVSIFFRSMMEQEPELIASVCQSLREFSHESGPVIDQLLATAAKSILKPLLRQIWTGDGKVSKGDLQHLTLSQSLIKALDLSSPAHLIAFCKLIALDSLAICSTTLVVASEPKNCHQLVVQRIAHFYLLCLSYLARIVYYRASSSEFLNQLGSRNPAGDSKSIKLLDREMMPLLLLVHYAHRIARSELSERVLGAGKYNAIMLWLLERCAVDPWIQGSGPLAFMLWALHCLWPIVWLASAGLPYNLVKGPFQIISAIFDGGQKLCQICDGAVVHYLDKERPDGDWIDAPFYSPPKVFADYYRRLPADIGLVKRELDSGVVERCVRVEPGELWSSRYGISWKKCDSDDEE